MIDRKILKYAFDLNSFPAFTCPRCSKGHLDPIIKPEAYHPAYSQQWQIEDWSWFDDVVLNVSSVLRCNNKYCGEQAVMHAEGGVEPAYDHDGSTITEEYYRISSIFPAPHIIDLPNGIPDKIKSELEASFATYWFQKGLTTNAIRNSIEALLDHFGYPEFVDGVWKSLGKRLVVYSEKHPEHADFLKILRPIINSGSHGTELETGIILDVYEALEIFLHKIFDDRANRFEELKERLRKLDKKAEE